MPPGPNGLEVIATVRAAGAAGAAILYTNYRSSGLVTDAREYGATLVSKGPLHALRDVLAELTAVIDDGVGDEPA